MANRLPQTAFDVTGRVVVVTGGGGFLGSEYARALAASGAHPVLADVDGLAARRAAEVSNEAAGTECSLPVEVDVTDPGAVRRLAGLVLDTFGRADALVNNASLDPKMDPAHANDHTGPFEHYSLDAFRRQFDVDVTGAFLCAQAFAPALEQSGRGVIINISSIYGVVGPDQRLYDDGSGVPQVKPIGYAVTKAALLGLTRYLATYYAGRIRVNALVLGGVFDGHDEGFAARYGARVPIGRMAHREEYAPTLLYLISDASSYVTGAHVVVDGGWTAW